MSNADLHRSERHAALAAQDFADTHPTRAPFLFGSPEEVRRTGFGACHGPCDQGRRECQVPDACQLPDDADSDFGAIKGLLSIPGLVSALIVVGIVLAVVFKFGG